LTTKELEVDKKVTNGNLVELAALSANRKSIHTFLVV